MNYSLNEIEQLAIANLSPAERGVLAEHMLDSVQSDTFSAFDENPVFIAEMKRRVKAIEEGTAKFHSHEEVMAYMRDKHGWT